MARGRKASDLKGKTYGRLTVIERAENKNGRVYWICKCECGNEKVISGSNLKSGATTSCGCLHKEKVKEKWQDEEFKQMKREKMKEKWRDEDYRQMKIEQVKQQWQDEEFKQMQIKKAKQQWQDEEMKWKMHYKGGITPITKYLRHLNSQWFELCKQQANYTCELTGKRGCKLNTHHLKAFSTIVLDAHTTHNIQIKETVSDYTEQELQLLEQYVAEWHEDNSNAVVLCEEVHILFHNLYGRGDNTPQQYEEFKQRYLAGEFNNLDSNNNKVA